MNPGSGRPQTLLLNKSTMASISTKTTILFFLVSLLCVSPTIAKNRHVITFRSSNLFPESLAWDPSAQHFIVGSSRQRTINSISDAGIFETLITDHDLPQNVTILGVCVDSTNGRLLAAVHASDPLPPFNALAAYDLSTRKRLFLAHLLDDATSVRPIANDVTVDFNGNAFVTNSASNFIWKVSSKGEPSTFSRSPIFTSQPVDQDKPYKYCSLNGIAYVSKGYLLVVQSNTGKMFKVDAHDGRARLVLLNKNLMAADGITVRSDGIVVVVSQHKAWLLKSDDSWGEGVVYDEIALDGEKFPSSVAVRDNKMYVLYGHVDEGLLGNVEREYFGIEQIESEKESEEENIWVYLLIGFGLAYFMYWRFQMGQLVKSMNKKNT